MMKKNIKIKKINIWENKNCFPFDNYRNYKKIKKKKK
jgi:hypothetical protein